MIYSRLLDCLALNALSYKTVIIGPIRVPFLTMAVLSKQTVCSGIEKLCGVF